jgi:type II secretory pathway pseudopilin PulG
MQRAKQKRTMADMRSIATAWEARATDYNKYNAAAAGITGVTLDVAQTSLDAYLSPTYIRVLPAKDGWGNAYFYTADKTFGDTVAAQAYCITSGGRNGATEAATGGPTTAFDCDIIYSNGSFVQYPEGVQQAQ